MKPHTASFVNAVVLFGASSWAWFASSDPSVTALIPAAFGVLLIACYPGVKAENKIAAHLAALLTLLLLVALVMPLRGALSREDTMAVVRVGLMLAVTALSLVVFVKSFIDVRKRRAES